MGQSRNFTLKSGATIHGQLWGDSRKEPVLCLSGFGCSHYNFLDLAKFLEERYFLILLDNRGLGQSSPVSDEYELKELAFDALEVMDQLNLDRFHVAGISMGGFLAQMIALEAPHKMKSLSLLCSTSGGADFIALPELSEESLRAFYALEEPKRTELAVMGTVHPHLPAQNPQLFKHICDIRRAHPVDVEQVLKQKRAVDNFLKAPLELAKIKCPTLILTGKEDRFVNPANAQKLKEKIPHAQLKVIEECDHFFFMEKPREVSDEMDQFIQGVCS